MRLSFLLACLLTLAAFPALAAEDTRPAVGTAPPDIFGKDKDGNPVALSGHPDKVVIITFWASWCGPCLRELPVLDKIRRAVGSEHLEVIAVNFEEPRRDFLRIVRELPDSPLTWVHDRKGRIAEAYGVKALPNMFIVDRDGTISSRHIGYGESSIQKIAGEMLALLPPEALARPAGQ
ncbi:TlpA family protein disulfide reductase [Arenimonas sp.]|uniref:TlpA family protein disulfide reductase n=1 Tax=Arenimonas sp. TaxID=1872635 RepID=UPI0035ADC763